ncbi:MAG: replication initiation factor domain-containing protein, partial [Oscillospiraceae bacterium]|nr:replication initiation factor domain-containing protein [Oscillospiraceae bacterium]
MVENWHISVSEQRKSFDLTQETFAELVGISRVYLNQIEGGKVDVPPKLRLDIEHELHVQAALRHCKQTDCGDCQRIRCPKEVLIDYVSIRFPHTVKDAGGDGDEHGCIKDIWESVLGIQMNDGYMFREERNYHNYTVMYQIWDITLRFSPKSQSGVFLEMRGKGCRVFEAILQSQSRSWYDFFDSCLAKGGQATRLDIAVDDTIGLLSIPELIEKRKQGLVDFGRVQLVDCYTSTLPDSLLEEAEAGTSDMGHTMNVGSPKGPIRFCLYEKSYEQAKKQGVPLGSIGGVKNRVEMRLRDDRAQQAIGHLAASRDISAIAFGILNERLRFFTPDQRDCPKWRRFAGEDWDKIALTTKPEAYTDERS